ncbi:MAG TPA: cysteine synthase family protein, partial [Candidatus Thermoplasmatota archaeon]|nr:cysteine synthase family protein [Candidatus Thermoplasmatota archaeon]
MKEPPVFALVGNTPLVEIGRLNPHRARGVRVFAKLEGLNPGGSVKDRAALGMVRDALARGRLRPGVGLLDATSGNTGIAYAMLCAALGARCRLYVPANASPERLALLRAYGAEVALTDPLDGMDGAIDAAHAAAKAEPDAWHHPDQYANPANPGAHAATTAPEIWAQTEGTVTHLVAGLGTTGTLMGTARGLRARNPDVQSWAVEPDGPMHGIEGLKHMPTSHVPAILRREEITGSVAVPTERARATARDLARKEG